jgi:hypothetical protein
MTTGGNKPPTRKWSLSGKPGHQTIELIKEKGFVRRTVIVSLAMN